jgi:hypothetical protein
MKNKLISIVFALGFLAATIKPVKAFTVNAQVWWNQLQAIATVHNVFPRAIICSGQAQGTTASGLPLFSYMNGHVIMPGQFGQINVFTNVYDPFISAMAFVNCNWL